METAGPIEYDIARTEHLAQCADILREARHAIYPHTDELYPGFIDSMHDELGGYAPYMMDRLEIADFAQVALVGRELAGFAFADQNRRKNINLSHLFISEEHRGNEIGTNLLSHLVDYSRESRAKSLTLLVGDTNKRAQQFYERYGFVADGVQREKYYGLGIRMVKKIRPRARKFGRISFGRANKS